MPDISRSKNRHLLKESRLLVSKVKYDEIPTTATAYTIGKLPANVVVTQCRAVVITAFANVTTAVLDVGVSGATDSLMDGADLESTAGTVLSGGTNAVGAKILPTGGDIIITPAYTGSAANAGEILLMVEYVEYERDNGEQINFSS
jgi:hypothetical protein